MSIDDINNSVFLLYNPNIAATKYFIQELKYKTYIGIPGQTSIFP